MPSHFILNYKKAVALLFICATFTSFVLTPSVVFAQALPQENNNNQQPDSTLFPGGQTTDPQAQQVISGQQNNEQGIISSQTVSSAAESVVACSAGQILGNILSSAISSAITSLVGGAVNAVATNALALQTVPVNTTFDPAGQHTLGDVRARTGGFVIFGIYINISWDSMAWCIVNAMIEYIADATIAWANSGFNGNPAFLENPERFFKDLADYQAGTIIRDIAYGATGVNVCQPFKVNIALNLALSYPGQGSNHLNSMYRGMSCRLSDITANKFFGGVGVSVNTGAGTINGQYGGNGGGGSNGGGNKFRSAGVRWGEWLAVTQNDTNNPYGAYIKANETLYTSVAMKQNELRFEVGLNKGWLSFKKNCNNPKDPNDCEVVTPGTLIQSSLEKTLGLPKDRLVLAQKFDQMVAAVVNNLIKIAINEVLNQDE